VGQQCDMINSNLVRSLPSQNADYPTTSDHSVNVGVQRPTPETVAASFFLVYERTVSLNLNNKMRAIQLRSQGQVSLDPTPSFLLAHFAFNSVTKGGLTKYSCTPLPPPIPRSTQLPLIDSAHSNLELGTYGELPAKYAGPTSRGLTHSTMCRRKREENYRRDPHTYSLKFLLHALPNKRG
jgi:hypothetical protein